MGQSSCFPSPAYEHQYRCTFFPPSCVQSPVHFQPRHIRYTHISWPEFPSLNIHDQHPPSRAPRPGLHRAALWGRAGSFPFSSGSGRRSERLGPSAAPRLVSFLICTARLLSETSGHQLCATPSSGVPGSLASCPTLRITMIYLFLMEQVENHADVVSSF